MTIEHAAQARTFAGCRFRPQGRVPDLGLDCAGLTLAVYRIGDRFRRNYRLRGDHLAEIREALAHDFRRVSPRQSREGDLLLWRIAADQLHMGVACGETFVHADAGIGRVVETPMPAPADWTLTGIYRRRVRRARKG